MSEAAIQQLDNKLSGEQQVRYLQEALPGKDWRTTLIFPDASPKTQKRIDALLSSLDAHEYHVTREVDNHNQPLLHIHHFGHDTGLLGILRESGIGVASSHALANPISTVTQAGQKIYKSIDGDPARLNGLIFILAEIFLSTAGIFGNKRDPLPDHLAPLRKRSNLLQTIAGSLFLAQSFTYLLFARSSSDVTMEQLRHKLDKNLGVKGGGDVEHVRYDSQHDQADRGPMGAFSRFLQRYSIQIGALFNDIGMGFYIGHVLSQKQLMGKVSQLHGISAKRMEEAAEYSRKGWKFGLVGCISSIGAWSLLLLPHKQKEDQHATEGSGKKGGLFHWLKDNPQVATGAMAVGSSSLRLIESLTPGKTNFVQAMGEAIYIPGDVMLMFIHNDEYGNNSRNQQMLGKKLAHLVSDLPVAIGPESQRKMANNIGAYLQAKALDDMALEPEKDRLSPQQVAERSRQVVYWMRNYLQKNAHKPFDRLTEAAVMLVSHYPESQRAQVRDQLVQSLGQLSWVHATPQELQMALETRLVPPTPATSDATQLNKAIGAVAAAVPHTDAAQTALLLNQSLARFAPSATPGTHVSEASRDAGLAMALEAVR